MLNLFLVASAAQTLAPLPPPPATCDPFFIFFEEGSARVSPEQQRMLDHIALAAPMFKPPVKITGYAADPGSDADNLNLSMRRASAVRDALIERGMARDRLALRALGKLNPLPKTKDGSSEQMSRRVTVDDCPSRNGS